jgi:hypothetical protein
MSRDSVVPVPITKLERDCSIHVKFKGRGDVFCCRSQALFVHFHSYSHANKYNNRFKFCYIRSSHHFKNFSNNYTHKSSDFSWLSNLHSPASTPPFPGMLGNTHLSITENDNIVLEP